MTFRSFRSEFAVTHTLHFRDARLPTEMRFEMERRLMILFAASLDAGRLRMSANATIVGTGYTFDLCFDSIEAGEQCYSFCMTTSWSDSPATHHDYYRQSADSWFALFTRDLAPAEPPTDSPHVFDFTSNQYRLLCDAALHAEDHRNTTESIQQSIVAAMKRGSYFSTSHKEGGSHLRYRDGRFIRTDHGDNPAQLVYPNETDFLTALRHFCNMTITQHATGPLTDIDAWKLILRLLETQ